MTPPTFTKGTGRLATDRYDFQSHINGQGFRQNATTVDVANPSLVFGNPPNVEVALENLNNFITTQINAGQGFCVVGDGYNTWHNANGTINFDPAVPSLDTILNPVFSAILNGTALPAAFQRVKYGGIVLIKAGTYIVKQTINVPPGITLIGENYGTKIINATSLDFSGSTPPVPLKGSPTPAAVFNILADGYRSSYNGFTGGADYAVDPNLFMFSREVRICNMVIADNFVEPTLLGDTFYKLPQNTTSATALNPPPLVSQQLGSNLSLIGVLGLGRATFSSGKIVSGVTGSFIGIDGSTTDTETFCKIDNCFFDGFSIPINMATTSAFDGYGQDFLEIKNSRMRAYGYYNGDSTDGYANTLIKCNVQNIAVSDSLFYGNATNVASLVYLVKAPPSIPALQDRSKIVIVGNQVIINKTSNDNGINATWLPLYFSSAITVPINYLTSLVYGNDFQDTFNIYIDDGYQFSSPGIGSPQLSINRNTHTTDIRNDTINLDGYFINLTGNTTMPNLLGTTVMTGGATISGNSGASIQMHSGSQVLITPGGEFVMSGVVNNDAILLLDGYTSALIHAVKIQIGPRLINTATYTVDTGTTPPLGPGYDNIMHIDTTAASSFNIFLPQPTPGRYLVFKDIGGTASTHNIFINPHGSEAIEGLHAIYVLAVNHGSVTLHSDGIDWWIIAKV